MRLLFFFHSSTVFFIYSGHWAFTHFPLLLFVYELNVTRVCSLNQFDIFPMRLQCVRNTNTSHFFPQQIHYSKCVCQRVVLFVSLDDSNKIALTLCAIYLIVLFATNEICFSKKKKKCCSKSCTSLVCLDFYILINTCPFFSHLLFTVCSVVLRLCKHIKSFQFN